MCSSYRVSQNAYIHPGYKVCRDNYPEKPRLSLWYHDMDAVREISKKHR